MNIVEAQAVDKTPLKVVSVNCCVCGSSPEQAERVGSGYDYEYFCSPDRFDVYRCNECTNVYLNPRPDVSEFQRIYPPTYHSLDFSEQNYSFVHKVRSRLEANRLLKYVGEVPSDAKILDVGCGDGFHLRLLQEFGEKTWTLEGLDLDSRAVAVAAKRGLAVREGSVEDADLESERYDVIYTIQTIEHVANPATFVQAIRRLLKPGGKLVIVTDNTNSFDFGMFKKNYWGGYHFPRHWNLFNSKSVHRLAEETGFKVAELGTIVSPVNWVYSIHNFLVAKNAPRWLIGLFTLKSTLALGAFTVLDMVLQKIGRGALLKIVFTRQ